jgi:hypothetical protein
VKSQQLKWLLRGFLVGVAGIFLMFSFALKQKLDDETASIRTESARLDHYCMFVRFETERVIGEADLDQHAQEHAVANWTRLAAIQWAALRPCLLDGTSDEPTCYPGDLACTRVQARFARAHFEYGFLREP